MWIFVAIIFEIFRESGIVRRDAIMIVARIVTRFVVVRLVI